MEYEYNRDIVDKKLRKECIERIQRKIKYYESLIDSLKDRLE